MSIVLVITSARLKFDCLPLSSMQFRFLRTFLALTLFNVLSVMPGLAILYVLYCYGGTVPVRIEPLSNGSRFDSV